MVEKFLIDSNSFMTPYRQYYAFDLVPTFWKELSKRTDSGNLILLDMVKAEIEKGKTVDIVLGAGTPGNDQVYLPELLGRTLQDARSQILLAYLNLGQVLPDESVKTTEDLEKAVVYAQKPEYIDKLTVPQGSFVTLHVTLDEQKIATVDSLLTLPKK